MPKLSTPSKVRFVKLFALLLVIATVIIVAVPLMATSTPDYFSRYHLLNRRYVNLEHSAHEGIGCRSCHETNPGANAVQLTADYYSGLFKKGEVPRFFKFGAPTNKACLSCHKADWADSAKRTERIPHPAHTRVASEKRQCVSCHKWTAHLETYMDKHKKMPFSGVCVAYGCHVGTKQSQECFNCHHVLKDEAQWKTAHPAVVRKVGQNGCLESCHKVEQCQTCHTTGRKPQFTGLAIQTSTQDIEKLHVKKDWTAKYHGDLAIKDRSKCMLCHQSQGECQECHRYRPAFHGEPTTWIGRHSKSTKNIADPRCIECHKKTFCTDCHDQFKEME